jgi:hypothetical protein
MTGTDHDEMDDFWIQREHILEAMNNSPPMSEGWNKACDIIKPDKDDTTNYQYSSGHQPQRPHPHLSTIPE